ncbi:MAG: transglutaminase domain-containing protein [Clostridia bacterium]
MKTRISKLLLAFVLIISMFGSMLPPAEAAETEWVSLPTADDDFFYGNVDEIGTAGDFALMADSSWQESDTCYGDQLRRTDGLKGKLAAKAYDELKSWALQNILDKDTFLYLDFSDLHYPEPAKEAKEARDEMFNSIFAAIAAFVIDCPQQSSMGFGEVVVRYKDNCLFMARLTVVSLGDLKSRQQQLDAAVSGFKNSYNNSAVSKKGTVLEKYRYVRDYLGNRLYYNYKNTKAIDAHNAYGALVGSTSAEVAADSNRVFRGNVVCEGYAKAFKLLCDSIGLPALYVSGTAQPSGGGHAWNYIKIDNNWFAVDSTWDDVDLYGSNKNAPQVDLHFCTNEYFAKEQTSFAEKHSPSGVFYWESGWEFGYPTLCANSLGADLPTQSAALVLNADSNKYSNFEQINYVLGCKYDSTDFSLVPNINIYLRADTVMTNPLNFSGKRKFTVQSSKHVNNKLSIAKLVWKGPPNTAMFDCGTEGELALIGTAAVNNNIDDASLVDLKEGSRLVLGNAGIAGFTKGAINLNGGDLLLFGLINVSQNNTKASIPCNIRVQNGSNIMFINELAPKSQIGITVPEGSAEIAIPGEHNQMKSNFAKLKLDRDDGVLYLNNDAILYKPLTATSATANLPVVIKYPQIPLAALEGKSVFVEKVATDDSTYLSFYDADGRMLSCKAQTLTNGKFVVPTVPQNAASCRVFVIANTGSAPRSEKVELAA